MVAVPAASIESFIPNVDRGVQVEWGVPIGGFIMLVIQHFKFFG